MQPTRDDLRTAAREFNRTNPDHHADVLSTADQQGSTLTVYRRVGSGDYERIARWEIARHGVSELEAAAGYGEPTPDEQAAMDAMVAGIGQA